MKKIALFAALTKVDEARREVWGLATAEVVDKENEICDYASSKPYFEEWSREISAATSGRSLGNVREMHQSSAVGKLVNIDFDDENRQIAVVAQIVDDAAWLKCMEGVYTGFSIGGRYVKVWPDADSDCMRFTAQPLEISVVDNPCVPNAHFTAIKRDGSTEAREFAARDEPGAKNGDEMKPEQEQKLEKALAQSAESAERVDSLNKKLDSLESGLKELAEAFRSFTEGFAKSFAPIEAKRIARTSIAVSKEDDGRAQLHDAGVREAIKVAHGQPIVASLAR